MVHTHHQGGNKPQKVELSAQIEPKPEADISARVHEGDVVTTSTAEGPMETAAAEDDSLRERVAVKAEEAVRDPLRDGTSKSGAELLGAAEHLGPENSNSKDDTAAEGRKSSLLSEEFTSTTPAPAASRAEAVLAVASDCAALASELGVGKAITEDNSKGAADESADVVLIETAEPESNAVTPEAGEANDITSPDKEAATGVTETISEVVREEPNSAAANKDAPVEEAALPFQKGNLVKVHPARGEVPPDGAAADDEDVPQISEEENIDSVTTGESAEECGTMNPVEAPPEQTHAEQLPEVTLKYPVIKVRLQFIPEIIVIEGNDEGLINQKPGRDDTEEIPEAAIDVLAQDFEPRATNPQEPSVDNSSIVKEEEIVATVFVSLCGGREESVSPSDEPVAGGVEEATAVQEICAKGEEEVASCEEPVEESGRGAPVMSEENPGPYEEDATGEAENTED